MSLVIVKNRGARPEVCLFKGQRFTLDPKAEEAMPEDMADAFVAQCNPNVVRLTTNMCERVNQEQPATIFIANWTGNPDAEDEVTLRRFDKKEKGFVNKKFVNMLKEPRTVYRVLGGSQRIIMTKVGTETFFNEPKRPFEFPAFQVVEVPAEDAETILSEDQHAPDYLRGELRQVPAPSIFQPDMTWKLDDMRAYLKWMKPDSNLGPDTAMLEAQAKSENKNLEGLVLKAKYLLMKRLFFVVYDSMYRRPTKAEFDAAVSGHDGSAGIDEEAAMNLLKRAKTDVETLVRKDARAAKRDATAIKENIALLGEGDNVG